VVRNLEATTSRDPSHALQMGRDRLSRPGRQDPNTWQKKGSEILKSNCCRAIQTILAVAALQSKSTASDIPVPRRAGTCGGRRAYATIAARLAARICTCRPHILPRGLGLWDDSIASNHRRDEVGHRTGAASCTAGGREAMSGPTPRDGINLI